MSLFFKLLPSYPFLGVISKSIKRLAHSITAPKKFPLSQKSAQKQNYRYH